jgi:5-methylcytosine-specific restriction protein B
MLQDYRELAKGLKEKFQLITTWPEIEFNSEDKRRIKELDDVTNVDRHSFQIKIETNHCIIPGQYVLYAVCIKELALAVKVHMDFFETVKIGKSANEIGALIIGQQFDFANISKDAYSKKLGLKIFIDSDLNQGAKSIVNGTAGNYSIRGISDFYTSIILKPINIPAASSSILGKFIYKLTEHPDLYNYLEKRFINELPYISKEQTITKFVRNVVSFLLQYDGMGTIKNTYTRNAEPSHISLRDGNISLTSIFKTSSTLLDDAALSQDNRIRFLKDPLYYNADNEFVYLSTEWANGTGGRLDLTSFKALIEKHYPEFIISSENETHYLKHVTAYKNYTATQSEMNLNQLNTDLSNAGLKIVDKLVIRFVSSLLTKPFVILTGLSGSGKTKLAQAFVQWICQDKSQYCIVPVGADWTNREPLLGYPNALKPEEYVKPDSGVLDLIIQANNQPELPHFLILDEMNLSHVERYFADFLSSMESKEDIPLYAEGTVQNGVPAKLKVPSNFFIIGTVNIDETTNMFSPKVLDRANTIEFRVTRDEMEKFLQNIRDIKMDALRGKGADMSKSFLEMASSKEFVTAEIEAINAKLVQFFGELKKTGAEFGYRSATEILRLINQLTVLDNNLTTNQKIDIAIIQKLLPKLHGSRRKLCPVLETLGTFCVKEKLNIVKDVLGKDDFDFEKHPDVLFPLSLEKIARMHKGAIDNGFASFAEA